MGIPIRTCVGHTSPIIGCSLSHDVRTSYSVGADKLIHVFDLVTMSTVPPFNMDNPPGGAKAIRSVKLANMPLNRCQLSPEGVHQGSWLAISCMNGAMALTKLGPDATTLCKVRDGGALKRLARCTGSHGSLGKGCSFCYVLFCSVY